MGNDDKRHGVFRNLTTESEIGRVFIEYSSRGELVPDEPTASDQPMSRIPSMT